MTEVYVSVLVPNLFEPWAELLVDALDPRPGSTVLDVACGPGTVARVLARRVGAIGHVHACDVDPAMIAAGQAVAPRPRAAAIEYDVCPADELPLPDASVDAITCQQGLQFVPDAAGALTQMWRVARPGARLAVSVWRTIADMPLYGALVGAAEDVLGTAGGMRERPFALGDADELAALATDAGWRDARVSPRDLPIEFRDTGQLLRCYDVTPVCDIVRNLDDHGHTELAESLQRHIDPLIDPDGAVRTATGTHFLIATR